MEITYHYKIEEDGDITFVFRFDPFPVVLTLEGCEQHGCRNMHVISGFTQTDKPTCGKINRWNQTMRYSSAYLDNEQDPMVQSDLNLEGGVSSGTIREFIETFRVTVAAFYKHIYDK